MSQTGQIDYDALAKQYGATSSQGPTAKSPDYDALARQYGATSSTPPTQRLSGADVIKAAPKEWSVPWLKERLYNIADSLTEGLPAAGATAGALIGGGAGTGVAPGPGTITAGIGGAGIGGMAGEALKQHIRRALGFEDVPHTGNEAAGEIAKQGAIQGGIEAASAGMGELAPILRNAAIGQYTRALNPTKEANKVIADRIAPEMIDRGVTGSLSGIAQRGAAEANAVKPELDAAFASLQSSHPQIQGSGWKILSDLQNLKSKYIVDGKVANPTAVNAINGIQDIVQQYGSDISPNSLRKLKGIFDDPVAAQGGFAGADLTSKYALKANKAAANSIRDILHGTDPDVAALDKEMSFWLNVKKVAGASAARKTGQAGGLVKVFGPLATGAAGGTGFAVGGATGGIEAALGAATAAALTQAVRSPAWRTTSAVIKNSIADALASGQAGAVSALLARAGFAVGSLRSSHPSTLPANQP